MRHHKIMMICTLLILSACVPVNSQVSPGNAPEATSILSAPTEEPVMDIFKKPLVTHIYPDTRWRGRKPFL